MAAFQFPDPALQTTVVNPITGSTYQWKEPPGKWVVTVKMRDVGDIIWEGDSPPDPIGDYKLWYSTDTLELYFYYCDAGGTCAWVPTSAPITMLEDLDNTVFELRTDLTSVNLAVRENENAIGRTIYFSDSPPTIYDDIDSGNELADGTPIMLSNELNYKFWYDTARLELLILFRDEDGDDSYVPVSIPLESLPEPGVSTETFTYTTGRLQTAIEENYLHNLNQDTSINEIKNDIIELEEEIDAIAPTVERGVWAFNLGGLASSRGQLSMYDNDYSNVGSPIGIFKQAKSIWLNEEDSAGTPHGFDNVEAGNLLELFVEGEPDYGLFEVVEVHDETNGVASWWVIEVNFVRALSDTSLASNGDNIRLKIFSAPEGGTADGFVLKSGDTMTGDLSIDKSANGPAAGGPSGKEAMLTLKGDRTGTTHAVGTIQFGNASAPSNTGNLTYRTDTTKGWFNLNAELNISKNGLKTNEISTYSGSVLGFNKKMDFTNGSDVNARFQKGFVIKKAGQAIDGTNIFTAYNDFVEYDGPTNSDKRIANRKWIWENTVRDYNTSSNWGQTAGQYINSSSYGQVQKPGGSYLNKHNYEFLVSATGYGSFYVIGNDACVRNSFYVNSYAESNNPKGNRVATASSSRSMMSGMRQAILGATDFESLKARLLAKLEEMENSNEFSEEPTTFDIPDSNY